MAIKIKKPRTNFVPVKKEFTDRNEPREDFWKRLDTMEREGSTIITYYGTSGVGKTSLLEELKKEIKENPTYKNIAFVHIDFKENPSILSILQKMQHDLENYGCEFPLFYTAEKIYFSKMGNKAEEYVLDKTQNQKLKEALDFLGAVSSIAEVTSGIPVPIATYTIKKFANKLIEHLEKISDDEHKESIKRLNKANADEKNPYELYELLPELFAQDVNDWLNSDKTEKNYLVVFLDTYEALTNEESAMAGQLNAETWLRSETGNTKGIIFLLENTLWVISGRNELHWEGSLADELEQHLLEPLAQQYADNFLKTAGVANQKLREDIYNLTKGLPYFLDLCVDVYAQYKHDHNGADPDISIFGKRRENVVKRLLQYMDDGTRDMIKFLCGLGRWTDEIAFEIGTKTFNFSQETYDRVKNFSFIRREDFVSNDPRVDDPHVKNFETTIFSLDRNTQSILFPSCNVIVVAKTFKVADEYFSKVLKELNVDGEYLFNLEYWAKLTARFATSPDDLRKSYKKNFESPLSILIKTLSWFDIAENILKIFVKEFTNDDGKFKDFQESVDFAYFKRDLGDLKKLQGFYQDAFKDHKDAYEKFSRLLGEENETTIDTLIDLATDLHYLGRYAEALKWNEKVLDWRKENEDAKTIKAMQNLALTWDYLGQYDTALELQDKVLDWRKEILGDEHSETIDAMNDLALTLNNLGRYEKAAELQEKVLKWRKNFLGDNYSKTIDAMNNLALTLSYSGRYEDALKLQEQVLDWRKENFGDKHPYTINAMNNLALTLSYSGRYDKALELQHQVLDWRKEILGDKHPYTIAAMNNLATTFSNLGRYDKALELQEEVFQLRKEIFGDEHPKTIDARNHLASTFSNLGRYDKAQEYQEKVLKWRRNHLGAEHPKTIDAMKNLALTFRNWKKYDEALGLQKQIEQLMKKIFGAEHPKTIDAMKNLAITFNNLKQYDKSLEVQKQILSSQQNST